MIYIIINLFLYGFNFRVNTNGWLFFSWQAFSPEYMPSVGKYPGICLGSPYFYP